MLLKLNRKKVVVGRCKSQNYSVKEFKTFFYAGDLKMLYVLILLMVLDILTGTAKSY